MASAGENLLSKCKLMYGCISAEKFNRSDLCLLTTQNSVSCKNFGTAYDIVQKYNYANVAGLRYSDPDMSSYATLEDRSPEGNVHINNPPVYSEGPSIATLITQYGIGREIEENNIAQRLVKQCPHVSITSRLSADTRRNRLFYFNKALFNLGVQMKRPEHSHIKKFIIPAGIARRGRVDELWLSKYLPLISNFAGDMYKHGKEVVIVINEKYLSLLEKQYEDCKSISKDYFQQLKDLPVLSECDLSLDITLPFSNEDEGEDVPDTQRFYISH